MPNLNHDRFDETGAAECARCGSTAFKIFQGTGKRWVARCVICSYGWFVPSFRKGDHS